MDVGRHASFTSPTSCLKTHMNYPIRENASQRTPCDTSVYTFLSGISYAGGREEGEDQLPSICAVIP